MLILGEDLLQTLYDFPVSFCDGLFFVVELHKGEIPIYQILNYLEVNRVCLSIPSLPPVFDYDRTPLRGWMKKIEEFDPTMSLFSRFLFVDGIILVNMEGLIS